MAGVTGTNGLPGRAGTVGAAGTAWPHRGAARAGGSRHQDLRRGVPGPAVPALTFPLRLAVLLLLCEGGESESLGAHFRRRNSR